MTTLITAALIVFGIFGYRLLSVAALPAVDFPTIQITATLPGASPETMAASVAGPIERQLSTIAGITSMTSTSALGTTTIIIQFDLNRNIDGAALDVQTALTVAARRLPVEMTTPPFFRKVNPGDFPVLFIRKPETANDFMEKGITFLVIYLFKSFLQLGHHFLMTCRIIIYRLNFFT